MINEDLCHDKLFENINPKLKFSEGNDYVIWKKKIRNKYLQLLGINEIEKNKVNITVNIEYVQDKGEYTETRFTFKSEIDCIVPCYLLIPKLNKEKYPVLISLQGHSTGFHNSIGKIIYENDKEYIETRGDFGIQAVKNGYAALCIEQRGMGERKPNMPDRLPQRGCDYNTYTALLLGRTTIGERVWDISKAIDALKYFSNIDSEKIGCIGNSGGGTATYYAACYDQRIKIAVPSCAVCSYKESIANVFHCSCNYIPSAYKFFDMGELACMIAPRCLIVVAGEKDNIFSIKGIKDVYSIIEKIYKNENATNKCNLIISPREHWWNKDIIWESINKTTKHILNW